MLNANNSSIAAVDLGGTKILAGKIQNNTVAARAVRPVPATDSDEIVLQEIIIALRTVYGPDVAAIGIGVPSVVDVERGIVYAVQNIPSWEEVHLKDRLEKEFHIPVYVNNDANCFALGEYHYGKGRNYKDMVGMVLGTGLGAGIIIDGRLYNGSNCGAGEIGTIPYKGEMIESFASGQFFSRTCGVSGEIVFQRANSGDPAAIRAYEEYGRELAFAIQVALYAYDPEIIVLGGSVSKAFRLFEKSMRQELESSFAYQHALKRLVIEPSELPDVALFGAAGLHLDALEKHIT
jgi:glucokinase